jgi:hypothetical protein
LENCVAYEKSAEHPTKVYVAQMVRLRERAARNGNIDAIKKRHRTQNKKPENQEPADMTISWARH